MGLDGRRDDHRVDVGRLGDGARVACRLEARELLARQGEPGLGAVAHAPDLASFHEPEVADVVRPPLAKANDAYAHRGRG